MAHNQSRATYSFLYVDHGLSQSLCFLPKGSQAQGMRLGTQPESNASSWVTLAQGPWAIHLKILDQSWSVVQVWHLEFLTRKDHDQFFAASKLREMPRKRQLGGCTERKLK